MSIDPVESKEVTVLRVSDYGAKADGVTDDAEAIQSALEEAKKHKEPVVIEFEKNASYYVYGIVGSKRIFDLEYYKNLTLKGENTTIIMDRSKRLTGYANINQSENICLEGFNFKTSTPIYSLSTVEKVDKAARTIDIKTDISLGITDTYVFELSACFGMPFTDYNRSHMFIEKIMVIDAVANRYRVYFKDKDNIDNKLNTLERDSLRFIVPMPDWGQMSGDAVVVTNTNNLTLKDINMWSASIFSFHMRYNDGVFLLNNVNLTPEPGTDMALTGWRDGFHLKDNRCKFVFEDCVMQKVQDDVFNFSITHMYVDKVYSDTEFNMFCGEFNGTYYKAFKEGDTVVLYDENFGSFLARTKIKKVVEQKGNVNRIIVEDPIPDLKENISVCDENLGQPNSSITNCKINGTYRFRTPITIENCELATLYSWIDNEPYVEGPVPENILFKNCKIFRVAAPDPKDNFGDPDYMMKIGINTRNGGFPQFAAKNIVFEDCEVNPEEIQYKSAVDVKFIRNGEVYFRKGE